MHAGTTRRGVDLVSRSEAYGNDGEGVTCGNDEEGRGPGFSHLPTLSKECGNDGEETTATLHVTIFEPTIIKLNKIGINSFILI